MKKLILCFVAVFGLCLFGLTPKADARVFVNIGLPVPFFGYPYPYYGPGVVYYGGGYGYYGGGYYCGPRRVYYYRGRRCYYRRGYAWR